MHGGYWLHKHEGRLDQSVIFNIFEQAWRCDMSIEQTIRNYILENYLFSDDQSTLQNDESFLNKGIIDSTGILEVISFLESEFGVKVEDREMIPENLDSVNNLVKYVSAKQSAAQ
jgi:acyl carrier protein